MQQGSLKRRFTITIACVYLFIAGLSYLAFHLVTDKIIHTLGSNFASKQALLEKSKLLSAIQRDLSLSLKMADSPLLIQWTQNETNPELQARALAELESYRTSFMGKSLFFAIAQSGHYYFSDGRGANPLVHPRYTLLPENTNDSWFFRALNEVDAFELNVDYDNHLDVTKVWFNVVVKNGKGQRLGLGGSGIDISAFIDEIVHSKEPGVETILFGEDGAIEGHRDHSYVLHNSKVRGNETKTTIYDLLPREADRAALSESLAAIRTGPAEVATCYLTVAGKRYLAAVAHLKEIHWFNLVLVDTSRVVSTVDFLPILAITVLSLLAVLLIIGFLLNHRVLRPLGVLAQSSRQLASGNFDLAIPVRSGDEIGALTHSFNSMAKMVKDHSENLEHKVEERTEALHLANARLAESNRQVMDSIRYAQLIQASILPAAAVISNYFPGFFALYQPRDVVGGDFYYCKPSGDNCILALIDCTGHGVPGAFMTMTVNAVLDHVLDTMEHDDPAAILQELNRLVRTSLHQDDLHVPLDNGLDIGLCYCAPGQNRLVFAGARIDLHVLDTHGLKRLAGDKQPIGYRRSRVDFRYTNHDLPLAGGSLFVLTTDGLLDQPGGGRGWGFGRKRFSELLQSSAGHDAAGQKLAIEQALADYRGESQQRDDITVIGFKL